MQDAHTAIYTKVLEWLEGELQDLRHKAKCDHSRLEPLSGWKRG